MGDTELRSFLVMAKVTAQIEVTGIVRPDPDTGSFVSHCPEFSLYSAGNTELEAIEAIRSAVELFLRYHYERSTLGALLWEKGLRFKTQRDLPAWTDTTPQATVGGRLEQQQIPIEVPFYLLQSAGSTVVNA